MPSTLLKNCLTFYLAKCTVNISALQHYFCCNYNWYASIWGIKFVSPLTTRISLFSSFPARRPWCSNSLSDCFTTKLRRLSRVEMYRIEPASRTADCPKFPQRGRCDYRERVTSQQFCRCISFKLTSRPMRARALPLISIWSFSFQTLLIAADDNGGNYSRALLTFWLWRWIRGASKWRFGMWNMSVADERSDDYQLRPPFLPRMYRGAFTKVLQSNAKKITTVPW